MATPKRVHGQGPVPFQIDPGALPDDGSPVTFEQTFAKRLGPVGAQQNPLTEEDFENSEWSVEKLGPRGPQNIATVKGRPFPHTLRRYGPGQYVVTPLDRQGKPVESLQRDILVGNPLEEEEAPTLLSAKATDHSDAMPPWMQLMLQQQAEERAEARRREAESKREREAWEREQALKEEARREREERLREMAAEREAQSRKEAAERNNALMMAGLQMAQQIGSGLLGVMTNKQSAPAPAREDRLQELLLQHVLSERSKPQASGGLKESLDLLIVLDQVAQSRADRLPAAKDEEKEEDMGSTMMKMLPMLLASRMGGGGGGAPQGAAAPAVDIEGLLSHALNDPAVIAKVAARNPEAVARTFSKVVKSDPRIEQAVVKVLEEDDEG